MRSRALRLTRTTQSGAFDLHRLQRHAPKAFNHLLASLGAQSDTPVPLLEVEPSLDEHTSMARDLSTLARAARATWQEIGAQDLAVGWPFIEGRCRDGTWIRGPVLLYPVSLDMTTSGLLRWQATFTGAAALNPSLVQTLVRLEGLKLDLDMLIKADQDGLFKVDAETWRSLVTTLAGHGLRLTPNQPYALPPLAPLEKRLKEAREAAPVGLLQVQNHLILGRFPRWGSTLVSDYEKLLETDLSDASLGLAGDVLAVDEEVEWAEGAALEDEALDDASPNQVSNGAPGPSNSRNLETMLTGRRRWQVLSSDASQDAVFSFLDQPDSRGLVVQGPPGTGKSQLIANLVASAIASGERVLLVCQKRAALDVVAARLESQGLREPIALVNDVEQDRNAVCDTIAASLNAFLNKSASLGQLEQTIQSTIEDHDQALRRFEARLRQAHVSHRLLVDRQEGRPALVELQEHSLQDDGRPLPDLTTWANDTNLSDAVALLPTIESMARVTEPLSAPHPLHHRTHWGGKSREEIASLTKRLKRVMCLLRDLDGVEGTMTAAEASRQRQAWVAGGPILDLFESGSREELDHFLLFWFWTGGQTRHGEWSQVMTLLQDARERLAPVPSTLVTTPRSQLEGWIKDLADLAQLNQAWYRVFIPRWWALRKIPGQVLALCERWTSPERNAALANPAQICQSALAWHDLIEAMPTDNAFIDFGFQGDPAELDDAIERLKRGHDQVRSLHKLQKLLARRGGPYAALPDLSLEADATIPFIEAALADRRIDRLSNDLLEATRDLSDFFKEEFLQSLRKDASEGLVRESAVRLREVLEALKDAQEALRIDQLTMILPPWAQRFLREWRSVEGERWDPGRDAITALERAWQQRLLGDRSPDVIEAPLVNHTQLGHLTRDLTAALDIAGRGLMARHHKRLAEACAHPTQGRSLRKLAAAAAKRRWRQSLRQLVEAYWSRGLDVVKPCWFCSPESVAALFPLRPGLFDLVIFDEASQCPVESAIPALARSSRALIAGDDQQMPPTHFFRASLEETDDDDATLLASRSLLTLARIAFRSTTLRWHYRSRHEELVAFSNAAYYGQRLITAPNVHRPRDILSEGIHWEQVDGLWSQQTNHAEAVRVVELLDTITTNAEDDDHPPSIGVVTFNRKQAQLIEELIAQHAAQTPRFRRYLAFDRKRDPTEQLFIRNLENVQGDERDVIIFTVGYGPTEPGGRVHARFGPIGQEGGEKRLNVAITRARTGIWVVSSFHPDQLDVSRTRHAGPKLLKLYLSYVYHQTQGDEAAVERVLLEAGEIGGGLGVTGSNRNPLTGRRPGHIVREQLLARLQEQNVRFATDLGLGSQRLDIAVGPQGQDFWSVGIDCSEFLATRDDVARDVYTPLFWKRLGWSLLRITPSMWARDQISILRMIQLAMQQSSTQKRSREELEEVTLVF